MSDWLANIYWTKDGLVVEAYHGGIDECISQANIYRKNKAKVLAIAVPIESPEDPND